MSIAERRNNAFLVSIPLGVNIINVKRTNFAYKRLFSSYVLALNELSYEKHARKMLMKLTVGCVSVAFIHGYPKSAK